jgi:hypothetical protein
MPFRVSDVISVFLSWAGTEPWRMMVRSLMLLFAVRWLVAMRLSRRHTPFVAVVVFCASFWVLGLEFAGKDLLAR